MTSYVPTRPVAWLEARGAPHATDANVVRGVFTTATGRTFTQALDQPGSASFAFQYYLPNGQPSQDLALIDATNTDICFWVQTDSGPQCLWRGRLYTVSVASGQGGQVTVSCQCKDYKALLSDRLLLDADCQKLVLSGGAPGNWQRNYKGGGTVDLASIVWDFIRLTQARSFGTLGITGSGTGIPTSPTTMTSTTGTIPSTGQTGTLWQGGNGASGITIQRVNEFTVPQSLGQMIGKLGAGNEGSYDFGSGPIGTQGFEFDIVPDPVTAANKAFLWAKTNSDGRGRGTDARWVLDYGGAAASFTADWSLDQLGTLMRISVGNWASQRTIDVSSAALGRWEREIALADPIPATFQNPLGINLDSIDKAAADAFFNDTRVRYAYSVVLPPAIDPTNQLAIGLGDTAQVQLPTLSGISNEVVRVVGRTVTVSDNGDVSVALSLNRLPIFTTGARARAQQSASDKLNRLEKAYFGGSY